MSHNIACYRCGESLSGLSLPLSRQDQCPSCNSDLNVFKMCVFFYVSVPRQCREDGAEDVTEKGRPNFCDWFKPSDRAFDPERREQAQAAEQQLAALFGDD